MTVLEFLMKTKDFNLSEFARTFNISPQNPYEWKKGSRLIPKKYHKYLSEYFNVPETVFSVKDFCDLPIDIKIDLYKKMIKNDIGLEVEITLK
jgi:hypothetical protein